MEFLGKPSIHFLDKVKNIMFAYIIMVVWVFLVQAFLNYLITPPTNQFSYQPPPIQFQFFFSCIFASFWEELCFRYVPITLARKSNDTTLIFPIVLVTSIIFGWLHGNGPISLLLQGVMGFVFACVYIKNNYTIVSSMVLHSIWNMTCLFIFPRFH